MSGDWLESTVPCCRLQAATTVFGSFAVLLHVGLVRRVPAAVMRWLASMPCTLTTVLQDSTAAQAAVAGLGQTALQTTGELKVFKGSDSLFTYGRTVVLHHALC